MDRQKIIDDILGGSPNRLREKYFSKFFPDVLLQILDFTKDISDLKFKWKVWHWINNEPNHILCSCGKRVSQHISISDGYRKFCSAKCAANDSSLKEKREKTLLGKYGVTHFAKTEEYVDKVKKTTQERYGVSNFSKTDEYKQKSQETYLRKWGVTNFTKTDEYVRKSKLSNIQKLGVDSYLKTEEGKRKFRETLQNKIGYTSIYQNEDWRKANLEMCQNPFYIKYLGNSLSLFNCDYEEEHQFEITTDNYFGRKKAGNKFCTICNPISNSSSLKEEMLYQFISSIYNGEVIRRYKDKWEIDIYLPEKKLGFEFNGLYWHSKKEKNYHINKSEYFEARGIRIIHIWEDDWIEKRNILESQIKNIVGVIQTKISARKCDIREISTRQAKEFINKNHIQGYTSSKYRIGLFHEGMLCCVMTFDLFEGRKKMSDSEFNLNRFCGLADHVIVGGASKLFRYFIKKYKPNRIISYSDRDWSVGNVYIQLGFEKINATDADYKYVVSGKRIHKSRFRKSYLGYDTTESQYSEMNGLHKVWDCGKVKWEIKTPLN